MRETIINAMARTIYLMAYADFVEELKEDNSWLDERKGKTVVHDTDEYPSPGPGEDWDDYAPETPESAKVCARKLAIAIEKLNDMSLGDMLDKAVAVATGHNPIAWIAKHFAHNMAMEAMGTGIAVSDDFPGLEFKVPDVGYYWHGHCDDDECQFEIDERFV